MSKSKNWTERVYKPKLPLGMPDDWRQIRTAILRRDRYTCYRCDQVKQNYELSVHHILPRADGGHNAQSNLITLCHTCHDYVEMNKLNSIAAIIGSCDDDYSMPQNEPEFIYDPLRPEWHRIVYGGCKRRNTRIRIDIQ